MATSSGSSQELVRIALANVRFPAVLKTPPGLPLTPSKALPPPARRSFASPSSFADPRNTFHEKAALCRAAENTCYFATVNYASDGSPTTSAIVNPDGTVLAFQPYGEEGLLLGDLDLAAATGLLASRYKTLS